MIVGKKTFHGMGDTVHDTTFRTTTTFWGGKLFGISAEYFLQQ